MFTPRPLVCLLRYPSDPDPYEAAFVEAGFRVRQIPLLQFDMTNEAALREVLQQPERYSGIIVTSPRAVQAVERQRDAIDARWRTKPTYVVGPRTGEELAVLGLRPVGEETGSGEALAEHIVAEGAEKPLLFLCGNRRSDELPERLAKAGVPFDELTVYRTHLRHDVDVCSPEMPAWLVFFSPSGVEALEPQLSVVANRIRIAAIGPTTASALESAGVSPDAVAAEPRPQSVVAAIAACEGG